MAMDIAQLGFNIDSTPLNQSAMAMSSLASNARLADQGVSSLSQSSMQANSALTSLGGGIGIAASQLSMMAASLQTVVTQLQMARSAVDGTAASFTNFTAARDRVEALSGALGTGVVALEAYAQTAAKLHMTSIEMVTSIQRVTQAIEGQTAAGRQLREIMQGYGVNMNGMQPENADLALQQFIERARSFRASPSNYQNIQTVLGPMGVDALTSVMHPDYEPVSVRMNRMRAADMNRGIAQVMEDSTRVLRETRRNASEFSDLSSTYDLGRLTTDQQRELMTAFRSYDRGAPTDISSQANRLRVLQYLSTAAPSYLRNAAEVPFLSVGPGIGVGPSGRQIGEFMQGNPLISEAPGALAQMIMGPLTGRDFLGPDSYYNSARFQAYMQSARAQAARRSEQSSWGYLAGLPILAGGMYNAITGTAPNYVPLDDTRPEDPFAAIDRRMGDGNLLAGYGYGGMLRSTQAARQALTLTGPGGASQALGNFQRLLGGDAGSMTYFNLLDLLRRQEANATTPGGDQIDQLRMESWLRGVPMGHRGMAGELMRFAQQNQVSIQPWAERGLTPDMLLNGPMALYGAGQLTPAMRENFRRIQAADFQGFQTQLSEGVGLNAQAQAGIRAALPGGQQEIERETAYWNTYASTLKATKDEAKAVAAALAEVAQVQERQRTVGEDAVERLRRQNTEQEKILALMRAAGGDPIAYRGAILTGGVSTAAENVAPSARQAYVAGRYQEMGISAAQGVQRGVADAQGQLDQQRQLLSVAGARADIQQRVATSLEVERQFQDEIAKATEAARHGQTEWLETVLRQVQAIKDMRAEYEGIDRTINNLNRARDTNFDASFQDMLNRANPQDRDLLRQMMPLLRENPQLMGAGGQAMNNPLGLTYAGQPGATQVGRFASFATPEEGWNAMRAQFGMYADRGINTVRGLITRWAPPNENDTAGYIAYVARQTGLDPDAQIDLRDRDIQNRIFAPMRARENMRGARDMPPPDASSMMGAALASQDPAVAERAQAIINLARSQLSGRIGDIREAQGYSDAQLRAQMTMLRAGDFGRRLASAMVIDPRSPIGDIEAGGRVSTMLGEERLRLNVQNQGLRQQAEDVRGLTAAWREGREAGEAYERHLANENQIRALDEVIKRYPQLTKQIREYQALLREGNRGGDVVDEERRRADIWKNINGQMVNQNRLYQADVDAGPFASPSTIGRFRAEAQLRNALGDRGFASTSDSERAEMLSKFTDNETLRQAADDVRTVRQEFLRMETAAMSAFESAVIGGQKMSSVFASLGQDLERFLLRAFVERPLMKGLEYVADSVLGPIGKIFGLSGGGSSAAPSGGAGASTGILGAVGSMLGLAAGDALAGGRPMRFAASGMLIDRPTTFAAAGGTIMAGEIDHEAIFPLKRDSSGNLGLRVSGGGGPSIQIHAPIVVQGNAMDKNGKMDPTAMAAVQKQWEAMFNKSVRNVLANEQRNGGDLYVGVH